MLAICVLTFFVMALPTLSDAHSCCQTNFYLVAILIFIHFAHMYELFSLSHSFTYWKRMKIIIAYKKPVNISCIQWGKLKINICVAICFWLSLFFLTSFALLLFNFFYFSFSPYSCAYEHFCSVSEIVHTHTSLPSSSSSLQCSDVAGLCEGNKFEFAFFRSTICAMCRSLCTTRCLPYAIVAGLMKFVRQYFKICFFFHSQFIFFFYISYPTFSFHFFHIS